MAPRPAIGYPKLIHEAIRLRARERPHATAITFRSDDGRRQHQSSSTMTYGQLDQVTDRLASHLIKLG